MNISDLKELTDKLFDDLIGSDNKKEYFDVLKQFSDNNPNILDEIDTLKKQTKNEPAGREHKVNPFDEHIGFTGDKFLDHFYLPTSDIPEGFKGNYVESVAKLREKYKEHKDFDRLEKNSTYNVNKYLLKTASFEERIKYFKNPPIKISDEDRLNSLTWGLFHAERKYPEGYASPTSERKEVIRTLINDKTLSSEAAGLNKKFARRLNSVFIHSNDMNREGYELHRSERTEIQSGYLAEVKEMINMTQGHPELQKVYAEQLIDNRHGFATKELRKEAMQTVIDTCPGTELAQKAEKNMNSRGAALMDFADNMDEIVTRKLGGTVLGKALGIKKGR